MQKFDVLIVGAGMVGLTLALALRKNSQLSVAITDTTPLAQIDNEHDVRVSAINIASKNIFDNLGIWSEISQNRHQAYQHMHVWDKASGGKLDFCASDGDTFPPQDHLGWIIENKVIRHALWQKAQADEGISFFTDSKLASIAVGDSEVFASFAAPENLNAGNSAPSMPILAKLLVGADGANSWVRQQIDMEMFFKDYDHHAIVGTVKCPQGHQNTAWQVFLESGPLAFLPLESEHNDLCSIVYSTSPDEAQRLVNSNKVEFAKALTAASDGKLGDIELVSERFTYPLTMRLVQNFVKDRVILIGDAAHTIHPLAGQGVNLGLLDAIALVDTLCAQPTNELANAQALKAFARWRKSEASEMIAAMAAIKEMFAPKPAPLALIRGLGMNILNHVAPVKNTFISQALGIKDNLPSMAYKIQ
ncbi:UbiH/UbiF/VisC/COQ6 family ubiquinone biosynthesis hydroxylase [Colwellia sp. D2M02]|uniref:UbiH/UbiF/VisC/COQ6 family ubiquinone biosynthesis hydroxylase n=1 Tax=Colwellia sp. D2M02 TaxID=2841562 RepID=UPI001C093B48|nr:UbiH/UbiF/VisC/COQ6 family ubiquinone biosynthesis hydroxylase [Colwellia sp. D2M02]MBU2893147.1 UbiH/UbiF/VisC/COQ6 family ubiquinone biosynthesis hydroxylase [Colwellia sp. D2M02]